MNTTKTQFQKVNRPSFISYGHLCLPKRLYRQLDSAWGKSKTRGTCTIGGSNFDCYADWIESKQVWMLRVAKSSEALSAIGPKKTLRLELDVRIDSFELAVETCGEGAGR